MTAPAQHYGTATRSNGTAGGGAFWGLVAVGFGISAVSAAFPLTHRGSLISGGLLLACGLAAASANTGSFRRTVGDLVGAIAIAFLLRIPLEGLYESMTRFPLAAQVSAQQFGAGWAAWTTNGSVVIDGPDGTVAIACDLHKLAAWELLGGVLASLFVLARHQVASGRVVVIATGLWLFVMMSRFCVNAALYVATPDVLTSKAEASLRLFWTTWATIPWVVAAGILAAWAGARGVST